MVDDDTRPSRRKNTLFCHRCGHESPTDGDWRVRPTLDGAVYRCPACGADLATRPVGEAVPGGGPAAGAVGGWIRLASTWAAWPRALVPSPRRPRR